MNRLVRQALDGPKVPPEDSHVVTNTSGNTVTVIGHVRTQAQHDAVVSAVWRGHAVMAVIDDIEISYAINPVDVDLHVQQALDRSALLPDDSDVTADTKDSVITLTGHVRTWAEHDAVVGAALMAQGVIDIRDELQVTG